MTMMDRFKGEMMIEDERDLVAVHSRVYKAPETKFEVWIEEVEEVEEVVEEEEEVEVELKNKRVPFWIGESSHSRVDCLNNQKVNAEWWWWIVKRRKTRKQTTPAIVVDDGD